MAIEESDWTPRLGCHSEGLTPAGNRAFFASEANTFIGSYMLKQNCIFFLGWWTGLIQITLWLFNIAMENGPFIDDFPIHTSIYKGFSMAMLNNQRVLHFLILGWLETLIQIIDSWQIWWFAGQPSRNPQGNPVVFAVSSASKYELVLLLSSSIDFWSLKTHFEVTLKSPFAVPSRLGSLIEKLINHHGAETLAWGDVTCFFSPSLGHQR